MWMRTTLCTCSCTTAIRFIPPWMWETQRMAEEVLSTPELMPPDEDIQFGYVMMEYDGRVLASVGQRGKRKEISCGTSPPAMTVCRPPALSR